MRQRLLRHVRLPPGRASTCSVGVIDADNILFASEMLGAVRGIDPETGYHWDDTKRYIDTAGLSEADLRKVFELNARRVYPRLAARLPAPGSALPGSRPASPSARPSGAWST